jgi:hypothetical protein
VVVPPRTCSRRRADLAHPERVGRRGGVPDHTRG